MLTEMTEDQIIEMGRRLGKAAIRCQPIKERLEGIPPEKRLEGIPAQQRLEGIPTQELLAVINPEELAKYLHQLPEDKLKFMRLKIEPSDS